MIVGPGDDAAVLLLPPNELCVVTTDSVIADVHYDPASVSPEEIGHKAAARALSDLAAMAAHGVAIVVSLQLPRDATMEFAQGVHRGLQEVCDAFNVGIVGGDVAVAGGPVAVNVTAIGAVMPERVTLRGGAKPGDVVCVTGELGGSLLGRHIRFMPRVTEGVWLAEHAKVHAMIDISDGLARDANHLAEESHVGVCLDPVALPIAPAAHEAARASGRTALDHALYDGEDYELLFALPPRSARHLFARDDVPVRITAIGEVIEEPGLYLKTKDGGREPLEPRGWTHRFGE